jgi:hypothetical protein
VARPFGQREPLRLCGALQGPMLGLREPHGEVRRLALPLGNGRPPHPLRGHVVSVWAIAVSSSSPILHTVDETPAAMAGVQRSVEWMRTKL